MKPVRVIRTRWIPPFFVAVLAQTWGRFILVRPDVGLTTRLMAHELAHVNQWRRLGIAFPFVYGWHLARAGFDAYRNHRENPLELEAHEAEGDPHFVSWAERVLRLHTR